MSHLSDNVSKPKVGLSFTREGTVLVCDKTLTKATGEEKSITSHRLQDIVQGSQDRYSSGNLDAGTETETWRSTAYRADPGLMFG